MNTKTQELVTAGYALANGLDAESAKLVKQMADELAVQRVRADELNKQVVNLAVENAQLKQLPANNSETMLLALDAFNTHGKTRPDIGMQQAFAVLMDVKTPATDIQFANIQAQGVEKFAEHPALGIISCSHIALEFAAELRKGAAV